MSIFLSIILTFAFGAQKNRLTETVLRVHARFLSGFNGTFFSKKKKSADFCKDSDWVRAEYVTGPRYRTLSLTKRSDQRLRFKVRKYDTEI